MASAAQGFIEGGIDFTKYAVRDAAKRWFVKQFKRIAPLYGCIDGPLDEDVVDEVYFLMPERKDEATGVICRGYEDPQKGIKKGIQQYLSGGMTLDDCLKTDAGTFTNMDGDVIHSYEHLYDDDFGRYKAEKFFDRPQKLVEKTRARDEFVDDQLRFCFRNSTYLGKFKNRDVYYARPNRYPVKQLLYFTGQALSSRLYYKLYEGIGKLFGLKKLSKASQERYETLWVDRYIRATQVLNDMLGLPKQIKILDSTE
jgi:hypothetical protein